ncbi:hypothetical protein CHUAL_007021 [Chamberlinius hualienensis]
MGCCSAMFKGILVIALACATTAFLIATAVLAHNNKNPDETTCQCSTTVITSPTTVAPVTATDAVTTVITTIATTTIDAVNLLVH